MSKKFHVKNTKEVDDAIRVLSSSSVPDELFLKKLFFLLKKHPQAFSHQAGRIESSLLSVINIKKVSCGLQRSMHAHYSHNDSSQNKIISLAAMCFSLLPSLTTPPHRADRFLEFQLKTLYGLSESYCSLLQLLKFSHVNLSSLHCNLTSKCKHFVSLDPVKKDEMPSPEYLQLIYARIDFFTTVIRSIFESTVAIECTLYLPMTIALFTAIFSVEFPAPGQTSAALLLRSSQLLHGLSCVCQTVGPKLMPASVSLLTLMVYQLDWTASWRDSSRLTEGFVRHRLAAYRCFRILVSGMSEFSSYRLMSLLPRLLDQVVQDLVCCSDDDSTLDETTDQTNEISSVKSAVSKSFKRRILLAVLDIVARVFQSSEQFHHPMESLLIGLGRLQLCLTNLMRNVTSTYFGGLRSFHNPITHPSVLISLLRSVRILCAISSSSRLRTSFVTFAHELKTHPDSQVRTAACEQLMLLTVSNSSRLTVPTPEFPTAVEEPIIDDEIAKQVFMSRSVLVKKVQDEHNSPTETDSYEESTKRCRMDFPDVTTSGNTEMPIPVENTSSNIDTCLSSFDPTFV